MHKDVNVLRHEPIHGRNEIVRRVVVDEQVGRARGIVVDGLGDQLAVVGQVAVGIRAVDAGSRVEGALHQT